ncbi:MAG TPA: GNAT family N-acetyltransferase [Ktedonobacterales bacterium]
MDAPAPQTTLGISIRLAQLDDAERIAQTQVAGWRNAYRGILDDATLQNLPLEEWTATWRGRLSSPRASGALCLVADDTRRGVVGFTHGGPSRPLANGLAATPFDAELYAIYLAEDLIGRGVGTRLTHALAGELVAHGWQALIVWALAENPFRRFYERLGGMRAYEQEITVYGQPLREVGYGWHDLRTLSAR